MAGARSAMSEYLEQTKQYDAGRPATTTVRNELAMTDKKPGLAVMPPRQAASGTARQSEGLTNAIGDAAISGLRSVGRGVNAAMEFGNDVTEGKYLGSRQAPSVAQAPQTPSPTGVRMPVSPNFDSVNAPALGVARRGDVSPVQAPTAASPSTYRGQVDRSAVEVANAWTGNYAAEGPGGQGIYKDPKTGKISMTLTGDAGRQFMNDRIQTARPGHTIGAAPTAGGRQPLPYNGMFANGIENTAQYKSFQMDKAAQAEKAANDDAVADAMRKNDLAIQGRLAKVLDDQAKGITSPEALAKMPYAQRRAIINERDMLIKHYLGDSRKDTSDMKRTQMTLGSEMDRAKMSDATTRRGQDLDAEGTTRSLDATAQSKELDRQNALEAAKIKAGGTKDPVMLERMKGFYDALANIYATGNEPTPEMLAVLKRNFGIFDDNTRTAAAGNAIP